MQIQTYERSGWNGDVRGPRMVIRAGDAIVDVVITPRGIAARDAYWRGGHLTLAELRGRAVQRAAHLDQNIARSWLNTPGEALAQSVAALYGEHQRQAGACHALNAIEAIDGAAEAIIEWVAQVRPNRAALIGQ